MKTINRFVVACSIVIATVAALLLASSPAQADSKAANYWASSSYWVNNNGSGGGPYYGLTAIDLHFSVSVKKKNTDQITSYSVGASPDPGGIKTVTESKIDSRIVGLSVSYTGISVTNTQGVNVFFNGYLNSDWQNCPNELVISKFAWSYQDVVAPGAPDYGFDFPDAVYVGPVHNAVYNFYNYDSSVTITLSNLSFYQKSVQIEPDSQWSPSVLINPFHQEPGPFVLQDGDSISIALGDLPNLPNSYIYVAGEMGFQMPDFDYQVVGFRHGHEELRQGSAQIPTLSEWGMIVFVVLLAGWMTFVVVRRWRASHATA